VLSGPAAARWPAGAGSPDGANALGEHQRADGAEQRHVGERDDEACLSRLAQHFEEQHADKGSRHAARDQHRAHAEIDIVAAPLGERARDRGGDDLVGACRYRDGGGNAREDQERSEQEAAADPEHAREKADRRAKPQHHQEVHRHLGNGQIDLEHGY